MLKATIFKGLREDETKNLIKCLGAKQEKFNTTETIMSYNGHQDEVGILLSGTADLVTYDYDGNRMILERYRENTIFGQVFAAFSGTDEPNLVAAEDCVVLFFSYQKALTQCKKACQQHTRFLSNLFSLLTERLRAQANHIEALTKRSLRGKLLAYFEIQAQEHQSFSFTLPFSLYALADYLSVDRSAMQREMKKMRDEGLIASKGRKIELLQ